MLSAMMIKVYQTDSNADSFNDCIAQGLRFDNQRDYQTVMIFIIAILEQLHAGFATKRGYYLVYFLQITSLAKVGDTFDDLTPIHIYFSISLLSITMLLLLSF